MIKYKTKYTVYQITQHWEERDTGETTYNGYGLIPLIEDYCVGDIFKEVASFESEQEAELYINEQWINDWDDFRFTIIKTYDRNNE